MEVFLYLVPLSLSLGLLGLGAFLWSVRSGQFDDLDHAAWHAILDDEPLPKDARPTNRSSAQPATRPSTLPGTPADSPAD